MPVKSCKYKAYCMVNYETCIQEQSNNSVYEKTWHNSKERNLSFTLTMLTRKWQLTKVICSNYSGESSSIRLTEDNFGSGLL